MAKIGDKAASYAPGFSSPIPYAVTSPTSSAAVASFPFALATEAGVFSNGRIDAWPGSRTLVLVVASAVEGKDPTVKLIIDTPPKPPAQGK